MTDVTEKRLEGLDAAVASVEAAAAKGRIDPSLSDRTNDVIMARGAVRRSAYGGANPPSEAVKQQCEISEAVVYAVESTVRAAQATPAESEELLALVVCAGCGAAAMSGDEDVSSKIISEYCNLPNRLRNFGWDDETPVSVTSLNDLVTTLPAKRPWWKFW